MNRAAKSKRRRSTFTKDVRAMNKTEDLHLQQELDLIGRKCQSILAILSQDKNSLVKDHKKILHLKVCEPQATADNTMREILESKEENFDPLRLTSPPWTSQSGLHSSRSHQRETPTLIPRRSKSALAPVSSRGRGGPPGTNQQQEERLSPDRPKSTVTFSKQLTKSSPLESRRPVLSILQLKHIAGIDNISERDLASQQQHVRQEKERLKRIIREKLRQKIQNFLQKLDVPETSMATKLIGRNHVDWAEQRLGPYA